MAVAVCGQDRGRVRSIVTVMDTRTAESRVVYRTERLFEAPNWSPDGKWLILNSGGKLWRLAAAGGSEPEQIPTGGIKEINNDHGISADGRQLAISAGQIYALPLAGGTPRQITRKEPSYFHGWAPDGKSVVYCAERNGNFDVYRIAVNGGEEERLTVHPGYDDGPEYSPDGKWIYFNSDRSGSWDVWRMPAAGAGPDDARAARITSDELEDWFPHLSPDGRWMVFLSFEKGTKDHPPNRNVVLRMAPVKDGRPDAMGVRELARLFGGQGTINVNSWAPDSRHIAYVAYEKME